jgi:Ni/Co efflux regulator RcnB
MNESFSHFSADWAHALPMGGSSNRLPETSMKRLAVAAIAVSLLGASVAMADGHYDHDGRGSRSGEHRDFDGRHGDQRHEWQRDERGGDRHDWREDARHNDADRWHGRRDWEGDHDWRRGRFHDEEYFRHGDHFGHVWHRGERLWPEYYAPTYFVRNYSAYQLREPPYGCRWVRVDNNVVLTAIATGVVLDIVYNVF